jgi:hypothetical protein
MPRRFGLASGALNAPSPPRDISISDVSLDADVLVGPRYRKDSQAAWIPVRRRGHVTAHRPADAGSATGTCSPECLDRRSNLGPDDDHIARLARLYVEVRLVGAADVNGNQSQDTTVVRTGPCASCTRPLGLAFLWFEI